jgi:hypothetical protein
MKRLIMSGRRSVMLCYLGQVKCGDGGGIEVRGEASRHCRSECRSHTSLRLITKTKTFDVDYVRISHESSRVLKDSGSSIPYILPKPPKRLCPCPKSTQENKRYIHAFSSSAFISNYLLTSATRYGPITIAAVQTINTLSTAMTYGAFHTPTSLTRQSTA